MGYRTSKVAIGALCVAIAALAFVGPVAAEMDHLAGYKVKSLSSPPVQVPHTVQDVHGSGTCTLKKAKFLLAGSEKDGGDDPRGGATGDYICYTAKCDLPEPTLPEKEDQLGAHTLDAKAVKLVCLPAPNVGCGDGEFDPNSEECDGAEDSACPGLCQSNCFCTPLPECQSTLGGFCWFLGNDGESCDTVCANKLRVYDSATETYAGSGGGEAQCGALLSVLSPPYSSYDELDCDFGSGLGGGLGCIAANQENDWFRCASPTTTGAASFLTVRRACACQ